MHLRGGGVGRGKRLVSAAVLCSSVLCPDSLKSSSTSLSPVPQIPALSKVQVFFSWLGLP